jgi:hypothetical protein
MKKPKAQRPGFWNADKTSGETTDKEIFLPEKWNGNNSRTRNLP